MKALIFSIVTVMLMAQAQATCAARTGGKVLPKNDYSRQLPDSEKSARQPIQRSSHARGTDSSRTQPRN